MTYRSTTGQFREERDGAIVNFDNTDGTTKNAWIPANGKSVVLHDVGIFVMNKATGSYIIVAVQIYRKGSWRTFFVDGAGSQAGNSIIHDFGGRVHTDAGDGVNPMVRVGKSGSSTNWESQITLTGQEV